ncbi:MAG: bifunctional nuclease family protein [Acidimicrobiales bacterium]
MVEVELAAVRVDVQSNTPVVLLQESGGHRRTLPIFIGAAEATAIAYALQGVSTPRPMTHDLMRDLLGAIGAELDRVVITELVATTYHAELQLSHGGQRATVSSRPSDAIALAARTGSPLFVADDLLDAEGVVLQGDSDDDDPASAEDLVGEFQRFLDTVRPEDFGPQ